MEYPSAYELRYFLEIANTLNVTRAAERLGVSQPSLSHAIRRLESSVGAPLLIRGKSGVQLTRVGFKFVADAKNLLESWSRIAERARSDDELIQGKFTIGCHVSVGLYSLPKILGELKKKHPDLEFQLVHDLSRKLTEEVIRFKIDFGLVINPVPHPDLVIRELCKDEVTFWISSASGLSNDIHHSLIYDPELTQSEFLIRRRDAALKLRKWKDDLPVFMDRLCLVYRKDAQSGLGARAIIDQVYRVKI
jgi:LysR family transcriptional regulator, cell division regulator